MLFNSLEFALFFAALFCVYWLLPLRGQNWLLLAASYFFYGCWDWRFLGLILLSTATDFYCGRQIFRAESARSKRTYLGVSLVVNLGMLGFFKYCNFFIGSFHHLINTLGAEVSPTVLSVVLPVGISFYTFQTLSYTIDIYRGTLAPEPNPTNFALFVAFFPQLVAGPIVRASHLLPEIRQPRSLANVDFQKGAWLIFYGLFLKVFVADNLARVVNGIYANSETASGPEVLLGTYAFAFQIFGDFAGYSSIAIGTAALLGFYLPENFRFPYFVTNPQDFWRNWHISLSTWLRDYLYIPLGGSRGGDRFFTYRNLSITMLLGGLWHGAGWTFVAWGLFHGGILILHRVWSERPGENVSRVPHAIRVFLMFQVTCVGWMLFRAESFAQLRELFAALTTRWTVPSQTLLSLTATLAFYAGLLLLIQFFQKRSEQPEAMGIASTPARLGVTLAMALAIMIFGEFGAEEFIYFQF